MAKYIKPAAEPWMRKKKQVQAENEERLIMKNLHEQEKIEKMARSIVSYILTRGR